VLLVGRDGRIGLCNDGARALLGLDTDPAGRELSALDLPEELVSAFLVGRDRPEELHLTDARVLLVSTTAVRAGGRSQGTVIVLRDHTELQALTGELTTARGLAEALRSRRTGRQRLHTVVSLVEIGRPAQAVDSPRRKTCARPGTHRSGWWARWPNRCSPRCCWEKRRRLVSVASSLTITPDTMIDDVKPRHRRPRPVTFSAT